MTVKEERDILAEILSFVYTKNQRLSVFTTAPTELVHQGFEIVDRLYKGPGEPNVSH